MDLRAVSFLRKQFHGRLEEIYIQAHRSHTVSEEPTRQERLHIDHIQWYVSLRSHFVPQRAPGRFFLRARPRKGDAVFSRQKSMSP